MITKEDAIEIARKTAKTEGWEWQYPVIAVKQNGFKFLWWGSNVAQWNVRTNSQKKGCNVNIRIDAESGKVLSKAFASR